MRWSFPVGTIKGTTLRVHFTFLLLLVWVAIGAYQQSGGTEAARSVTFVVLLFGCVVLHEFGHALMARRYGVRTPDITLLPIGGVARLERIPEKPGQELMIALAGPMVNVVIAAVLLGVMGGTFSPGALELEAKHPGLPLRLLQANIFLVVFNALPAFPMDGGRMLRALLTYRMGHARATQVAATIGEMFAFLLGMLGLVSGNPLLMFIGVFVYLGAAAEAHAEKFRDASRGLLAGDAAVTQFERLSLLSRVEDAVQHLIHGTQHDFPVVDGGDRLRGVLTRDAMIRALRDRGPDTPVMEVMTRDIPLIHHRASLADALESLQAGGLPAVGVVDGAGRLVGLITPENVGELMMVQAARGARAGGVKPRMPDNPWDTGSPA